jgi:hypothetical protein
MFLNTIDRRFLKEIEIEASGGILGGAWRLSYYFVP